MTCRHNLSHISIVASATVHTDVSATVAHDILEKEKAGEEVQEKAGQHI